MNDLLAMLVQLHPSALHMRAGEAAKRQAGAAWELAACLIAVARSSELFRAFDCTSAVHHAERCLGLGPCKALEQLRGGQVLERFPKLSEACRDGRLCWSKLREAARAVQPTTEEKWLALAVTHTTREIERAVSVSVAWYRREQAAASAAGRSAPADAEGGGGEPAPFGRASRDGEPASHGRAGGDGGEQLSLARAVGPQVEVRASLAESGADATVPAAVGRSAPAEAGPDAAPSALRSPPAPRPQPAPPRPPAPVPPRLVRVEMHLTPDQFAIRDKALDRVRSARSRHVSKEVALEALARHYLAGGDARTRTHHPVVLRADPVSGTMWYETSRGILPASAEATEDALARERGIFVAAAGPAADLATEATAPRERAQGVAVETEGAWSHEPKPMAAGEPAEGPQEPAERPQEPAERPQEPAAPCGWHYSSPSGRKSATAPPADPPAGPRPGTPRRKPIPASRRRAALVRANHRCERCGATRRLEVDHVTAVCDGGSELALQILCHDCHAGRHAEDFAGDPRYVRGRAEGVARHERRMLEFTASG